MTSLERHLIGIPCREMSDDTLRSLEFSHLHVLDQLSNVGYYKNEVVKPSQKQEGSTEIVSQKIKLYVIVSIADLSNIDPMTETFQAKLRIYAMWEVDLDKVGKSDISRKALESGHYYALNKGEYDAFMHEAIVPNINIFNALDVEIDDPTIRVYGGGKNKTAVMWNFGCKCTVKERFELHNFPFDLQELQIELRLNDSKTWDLFDLTVTQVQFNKSALVLTEWKVHAPIVRRENPKHKVSKVVLLVERFSWFYIQNVVFIMLGISLLGLCSFALDIHETGARVGNILTLILTAVAFKFILASILPKVPYNTIIDYYILYSTFQMGLMTFLSLIPSLFPDEDTGAIVNSCFGYIALALTLLGIIVWYLYALSTIRGNTNYSAEVKVVDGKNWYNFTYVTPHFLVVEDNKN